VQEDEGKLAPVEEGMSAEQLEEIEELARRVVFCWRWRWMPGMAYSRGQYRHQRAVCGGNYDINCIPDLTDPATLGCLLALVREAWGDGVYLLPDGGWYVKGARLKNGSSINLGICASTEAEALVAALKAAP
jgi:hypothetical protein